MTHESTGRPLAEVVLSDTRHGKSPSRRFCTQSCRGVMARRRIPLLINKMFVLPLVRTALAIGRGGAVVLIPPSTTSTRVHICGAADAAEGPASPNNSRIAARFGLLKGFRISQSTDRVQTFQRFTMMLLLLYMDTKHWNVQHTNRCGWPFDYK